MALAATDADAVVVEAVKGCENTMPADLAAVMRADVMEEAGLAPAEVAAMLGWLMGTRLAVFGFSVLNTMVACGTTRVMAIWETSPPEEWWSDVVERWPAEELLVCTEIALWPGGAVTGLPLASVTATFAVMAGFWAGKPTGSPSEVPDTEPIAECSPTAQAGPASSPEDTLVMWWIGQPPDAGAADAGGLAALAPAMDVATPDTAAASASRPDAPGAPPRACAT